MRHLVSIHVRSLRRHRRRRPPAWVLVLLPILACCGMPPGPAHATAAPIRSETLGKSFERSLAEENDRDRSAAPYFQLGNGDVDMLPLKETRADVDIAGVIAQVKLIQVYQNSGRETLEAIYVFPASTRAAVYAMKMTIGERVVEAKIDRREQARAQYEQAMRDGKTASLLEQQRPNVFTMSVGNIQPGDTIEVELFYTELLLPEERLYEFVLPTVVGPRYSNGSEQNASGATGTERWVANPYTSAGTAASYRFGVDVTLRSGMPLHKLASNHDVTVEYQSDREARIQLAGGEVGGNRDFVLHYALAGSEIESGLLLYPGADEQYFLLLMEPPERITPADVLPREYIFVVDVSGSMHGFPIATSKQVMRRLLTQLKPSEHFNVVLFAGTSATLAPTSVAATPEQIDRALGWIDEQRGGGGTELLPALRSAFAVPRNDQARIVVLLSDGFVSVEKESFELVRREMGDANLFAFGIGRSVNRFLIEGLARAGGGEPFVVESEVQAEQQTARFTRYVAAPLMRQVSVEFKGFDAYDVEPEVLPDLFAERPLVIFGKYRGQASGQIIVTGDAPGHDVRGEVDVASGQRAEENGALRYLWARQRIARLADQNKLFPEDARVEEVTRLGLSYSLLTDYTSFVAVDRLVRGDGRNVKVEQPLPLPSGVSNSAVGRTLGRLFGSGSLSGDQSGTSTGIGGLGINGTGAGGGGVGKEGESSARHAGAEGKAGKRDTAATTGTFGAMAPSYGVGSVGTRGRGGGSAGYGSLGGSAVGYGSGAGGLGSTADPAIRISQGTPVIMGSLDKAVIRRVIKENMVQVRKCYERALKAKPSLHGKIVVKFVIAADGTVVGAAIEETTLNDSDVEACLLRAVRKWRFPKPAGAGTVTISYPFIFKQGS